MHHHRAEHWIVVSGTAKVTNGSEVFFITENSPHLFLLGLYTVWRIRGKFRLNLLKSAQVLIWVRMISFVLSEPLPASYLLDLRSSRPCADTTLSRYILLIKEFPT